MVKKITQMPVAQPAADAVTVVCDEIFTSETGLKLRMRVDLATIIGDTQKRHQALMIARGIPLDRVNLSPGNDVVTAYREQLGKGISDDDLMDMARAHYERYVNDAYEDALVLAMFTHPDNNNLPAPEPYTDEELAEETDLVSVAPPKRNLLHPSEKKLKQIMDFVAADPSILARFQRIFNSVTVRINELVAVEAAKKVVDGAGFQPAGTRRDLPANDVAPDLQPEVQA